MFYQGWENGTGLVIFEWFNCSLYFYSCWRSEDAECAYLLTIRIFDDGICKLQLFIGPPPQYYHSVLLLPSRHYHSVLLLSPWYYHSALFGNTVSQIPAFTCRVANLYLRYKLLLFVPPFCKLTVQFNVKMYECGCNLLIFNKVLIYLPILFFIYWAVQLYCL